MEVCEVALERVEYFYAKSTPPPLTLEPLRLHRLDFLDSEHVY